MLRKASDVLVEVVVNAEIAPGYFSLRLRGPSALGRFHPGQFLMLGWAEGFDPFLPRAMSIRGVHPALQMSEVRGARCEVEILYKVYGRGTALLSEMRPGRMLRALGPLGNAFEVPRSATKLLLVAGGIGVPPIVALAEALVNRKTSRRMEIVVFLGGQSKPDLLCITDFRRSGATVHLATEDGSLGLKGLVTELVEEFLRTPHPAPRTPHAAPRTPHAAPRTPHPAPRTAHLSGRTPHPAPRTLHSERRTSHLAPRTFLYACGPHPMLSSLGRIAEKHDLPYQASLEANMACGFGACMGCVVPVAGGEGHQTYRLVCKDGPVFDGRQILWTNHG